MIETLLKKIRARDVITSEEQEALIAAVDGPQEVAANVDVVRRGELLEHSTILLEGVMCRYRDVASGERQITELHIAGDFVDLHSFTLKRLDHDIMSMTPCRIATVPHKALKAITERYPHLTRVLWFATNLDAAIHREWAVSLGRRSAASRIAHLLCELHTRYAVVDMAEATSYRLDLTQAALAEALGLTAVHVNRMLKALREQGMVSFRGGVVDIENLDGLRALAEFDAEYLFLDRDRCALEPDD